MEEFKKYGEHVHHLLLGDNLASSVDDILSYCPNVKNLMMHWEPNRVAVSVLSKLPLTTLSMSAPIFLGNLHLYSRQHASATHLVGLGDRQGPPMFPSVTHIDFICGAFFRDESEIQSSVLAHHFPSLTHIAVPGCMMKLAELPPILTKCKNLEVLVSWRPGHLSTDLDTALRAPPTDPRIIFLTMTRSVTWTEAAMGRSRSLWELADKVMAYRRMTLSRLSKEQDEADFDRLVKLAHTYGRYTVSRT
ncbi:hypothetical protein BDN72DRAFT_962299 [Pluteus cervinus]|uniref:Uncharacterized protein n=1 Tax=Pluteus cervinus TaxID=181527 RepID=A0ACD3AJP6_9AGAR|nr:hypothetical protein BDN72DRAFT_962299 [Pluteus cervinus]